MFSGDDEAGVQPHMLDGARIITGAGALIYPAIVAAILVAGDDHVQWVAAHVAISGVVFAGAWFALRRRRIDTLRRPTLGFVMALGILVISNPVAFMIANENAHPSIGMAVLIPALAAIVHHRRAAIALGVIANVAWLLVLARFGDDDHAGLFTFFGELLVIDTVAVLLHVTRNRTVWRLKESRREIARMAATDGLTGLANQRYVQHAGPELYRRTARAGGLLTVLFVDVDNLKAVNDREGHAAGDELIQRVAEVLTRTVREGDLVGRVGGDEFVVLGTDLDDAGASALKARVLEDLASSGHAASIGVATATGAADEHFADVLARADQAMYAEKQARRGGTSTLVG